MLKSMYDGWEVYLLNLRVYVTYFPGRRCATVMESCEGDWPAFVAGLGLADARVGDAVDTPTTKTNLHLYLFEGVIAASSSPS